jgi:hypothetical protein
MNEAIAVILAVGAVAWTFLRPQKRQKRPGRVFLDAMQELRLEAASKKIEELIGNAGADEYLRPFMDLSKPKGPEVPKAS